jgi:hypothetical protein
MSHDMIMRLVIFGTVAALMLVGFAMGLDSGGRPAPAPAGGSQAGSNVPAPAASVAEGGMPSPTQSS